MYYRSWIITVFLICPFFSVPNVNAQPDRKTGEALTFSYDTNYIDDFTQVLTARLFLLYQNASILINPADDKISKIVYRPNVNLRIGIAGFWKWFGLGISVDNPFYKTDRDAYGKTTTLDLRVNAFGREMAGELFFQQYKGFYIGSPEKSDGSHYILPEMRTLSIGVAGYWIYNAKRFSIRAAFIQNERQKRSAGSLVVRPSFLYYSINSETGMIPAGIITEYNLLLMNQVTKGTFYSIGLAPGYVYTQVFLKTFSFTAALFPGVAAQVFSYSNEIETYSLTEINFQLSGRFAIGYNSEKWFLGASVQAGFNEVPDKLNNALFSYDVAQFRFWGGTRFDIFKKKKRTTMQVN